MCVGKVSKMLDVTPKLSNVHKTSDIIDRTKKHHQIKKHKIAHTSKKNQYYVDSLAVFTYYTKVVLFFVGDLQKQFLESNYYKILFKTTQPAHLITALAIISIGFLIFPHKKEGGTVSPLATLLYLASFSAHFGAQIWMTFISGLALYFSLPRHTFGNVQQVLFPKYFLLNASLSLITLIIFLKSRNNQWTPEIAFQTGAMTLCFLTELTIRLYLTPPLLTLISQKNQIESEAGVGSEIGKLEPGNLVNHPHYLKIHKTFRKVHMSIAIGNLITMACTMLHLHYLSHKLFIM